MVTPSSEVNPCILFQHCSYLHPLPTFSNSSHVCMPWHSLPTLIPSASLDTLLQHCSPLHLLAPSYSTAHLHTPYHPLLTLLTLASLTTLLPHFSPLYPLPPTVNTAYLCIPLQTLLNSLSPATLLPTLLTSAPTLIRSSPSATPLPKLFNLQISSSTAHSWNLCRLSLILTACLKYK